MLATVLLGPDAIHVREISARAQLPYSVVQREIDRLEGAAFVKSTRFASARVVRANEQHPFYPELRALLLKAYGPRTIIAEAIAGEAAIRDAYIFGSWAARYHGEWGAPPADVDVVLVGRVPAPRVEELEAEIEDRLGQAAQIVVIPPSEWAQPSQALTRTIQKRPLVRIDRGDTPDG